MVEARQLKKALEEAESEHAQPRSRSRNPNAAQARRLLHNPAL
jgi:hypothetical protein